AGRRVRHAGSGKSHTIHGHSVVWRLGIGPERFCISPSPHRDALMLAPDPDLAHIWLADLLDADVGVLPCIRRVRPTLDLPHSGLVDEPVADLELHRNDLLLGGLPRRLLTLLLKPRASRREPI